MSSQFAINVSAALQQQETTPQGAANTPQSGGGASSFESLLRQDGGASSGAQPNPAPQIEAAGSGTSGARLDQMRLELMPEWIDTQSRYKMLREALSNVRRAPTGTDIRGRFRSLEQEWQEVEQIMRSPKDLSQGELLGLQARLYQVSQHIEVMSKVVDQMTGGIKTILNTNV